MSACLQARSSLFWSVAQGRRQDRLRGQRDGCPRQTGRPVSWRRSRRIRDHGRIRDDALPGDRLAGKVGRRRQRQRDLPDLDRLEAAGLLGKAPLPDELRAALGLTGDAEYEEVAEIEADDEYMGVGLFGE